MGEHYQQVKEFQRRSEETLTGLLLGERMAYQDLAELILAPLDSLPERWGDQNPRSDGRTAQLSVLARIFNDFECAQRLILLGMPEQAPAHLRDVIECILLLRLFIARPDLGHRWLHEIMQYEAGTVCSMLEQRGLPTTEYAWYGMLSAGTHAGALSAAGAVREELPPEGGTRRSYYFGGHRNHPLLFPEFHLTLVFMAEALSGVIAEFVAQFLSPEEYREWWARIAATIPSLRQLGIGAAVEEDTDGDETDRDRHRRVRIRERLRVDNMFDLLRKAGMPEPDASDRSPRS